MHSIWLRTRSPGGTARIAVRQHQVVDGHADRAWLDKGAKIATIVTCIVAVSTLYFGYSQFERTQTLTRQTLALQKEALQHERDARAIDLSMKFNEIQQAIPLRRRNASGDALFWKQNLALIATESVFELVGTDPQWRATVAFMLREQTVFLKEHGLECDTFLPKFIEFAKEVIKHDMCQ